MALLPQPGEGGGGQQEEHVKQEEHVEEQEEHIEEHVEEQDYGPGVIKESYHLDDQAKLITVEEVCASLNVYLW